MRTELDCKFDWPVGKAPIDGGAQVVVLNSETRQRFWLPRAM